MGERIGVSIENSRLLFYVFLTGCLAFLFLKIRQLGNEYRFVKTIYPLNLILVPSFLIVGIVSNVFLFESNLLREYIQAQDSAKLQVLVLLMISVDLLIRLKAYSLPNETSSHFLDDTEIQSKDADRLGMSESASRFAENVFNKGDRRSLVFGIDAPWGIGKTSFLNLCEEYWSNRHRDKLIVYRFSPLDYSSDTDLVSLFLNGLSKAIQQTVYVPQLDWLVKRYDSYLKTGNFSFFSYQIPTNMFYVSENQVLEGVRDIVNEIGKKVIVIVDDLDRVDFDETRDILFVIRRGLSIDRISYVIAYDSNTLTAKGGDKDNITEYLEKFINVRFSLFTKRNQLIRFLTGEFAQRDKTRIIDPAGMRDILSGFVLLLSSNETAEYQKLLGDLRKLKRLVNVIIISGLDKISLKRADIDPRDLAHLLLLYVHFPITFRTIFDSETEGRYGLVSLERKPGNDGYQNTPRYEDFLNGLSKDEIFLIKKIFSADRADDSELFSEEISLDTLACINDKYDTRRNLERYLSFIVDVAQPDPITQLAYFQEKFDLVKAGTSPEDLFSDSLLANSEAALQRMWLHILENKHAINRSTGLKYFHYLLSTLARYNTFTSDDFGNGLRPSAPIYLTNLIDRFGWDYENHSNSDDDAVKEILSFVFEENGVIETLTQSENVLQLHDLMIFRLYCSADRGGDNWNLSAALTLTSEDSAMREGSVEQIAILGMRKLSQEVFSQFSKCFIDRNRSVAIEIDRLTVNDLLGEANGSAEIDSKDIQATKSRLLSFIIYQLANKSTRSGVGCGYYDLEGKDDAHQIREAMNDYLFEICFDPNDTEKTKLFIKYLFAQYDTGYSRDELFPRFGYVFEERNFQKYWSNNADVFRKTLRLLAEQDENVLTNNSTISIRKQEDRFLSDIEAFLNSHTTAEPELDKDPH